MRHNSIKQYFIIGFFLIGLVLLPASFSCSGIKSDLQPSAVPISFKIDTAKAGLSFTSDKLNDTSQSLWIYKINHLLQTIVDIVLVTFLILIAFANILGYSPDTYSIKKLLPKLIFVAVLANLSLPIIGLASKAIDSLMLSVGLFNPANIGTGFNLSVSALGGAGLVIALIVGVLVFMLGGSKIFALVVCCFAPIVPLVATVLILLILDFRPWIVFLGAAAAPLMIAFSLIPGLEGVYKKWLKILATWLVIPPLVFLIMRFAQYAQDLDLGAGMGGDRASLVSNIVGLYLPLALQYTILLFAVRIPFMLEKDVSGIIAGVGKYVGNQSMAGIANIGSLAKSKPFTKMIEMNEKPEAGRFNNLKAASAKILQDRIAPFIAKRGPGDLISEPGKALEKAAGPRTFLGKVGGLLGKVSTPSFLQMTQLGELHKLDRETGQKRVKTAIVESSPLNKVINQEAEARMKMEEAKGHDRDIPTPILRRQLRGYQNGAEANAIWAMLGGRPDGTIDLARDTGLPLRSALSDPWLTKITDRFGPNAFRNKKFAFNGVFGFLAQKGSAADHSIFIDAMRPSLNARYGFDDNDWSEKIVDYGGGASRGKNSSRMRPGMQFLNGDDAVDDDGRFVWPPPVTPPPPPPGGGTPPPAPDPDAVEDEEVEEDDAAGPSGRVEEAPDPEDQDADDLIGVIVKNPGDISDRIADKIDESGSKTTEFLAKSEANYRKLTETLESDGVDDAKTQELLKAFKMGDVRTSDQMQKQFNLKPATADTALRLLYRRELQRVLGEGKASNESEAELTSQFSQMIAPKLATMNPDDKKTLVTNTINLTLNGQSSIAPAELAQIRESIGRIVGLDGKLVNENVARRLLSAVELNERNIRLNQGRAA